MSASSDLIKALGGFFKMLLEPVPLHARPFVSVFVLGSTFCVLLLGVWQKLNSAEVKNQPREEKIAEAPASQPSRVMIGQQEEVAVVIEPEAEKAYFVQVFHFKQKVSHILHALRASGFFYEELQMDVFPYTEQDHILRLGLKKSLMSGYPKNEWSFSEDKNASIKHFADKVVSDVIKEILTVFNSQNRLKRTLSQFKLEVHIKGYADAYPIIKPNLWTGPDFHDGSGIVLEYNKPVDANLELALARAVFLKDYMQNKLPDVDFYVRAEADREIKDKQGTYRKVHVDVVLKGIKTAPGFETLSRFESTNLN